MATLALIGLSQPCVCYSIAAGMDAVDVAGAGFDRGGTFPSTHWSVVLRAGAPGSVEADQALGKLCEAYWYPLYVFLRKDGHPPEEAEDLVQEFLGRLVHKEILAGLTRDGGKFRSFLLTALKRFVVNEWNREHAQKRAGGKVVISIDDDAEQRYRNELVERATPEALFERQWAFTLLDRVLDWLRYEYNAAGKQELFARLQGFLPGAREEFSYAQIAADLHIGDSAVRMATLRLRRRYGQLLRAEIAHTVSRPEEIDEEIQHLIAVATST